MKSLSLIFIRNFDISLPGIRPGADSDHQIARSRSLWLPLQFHTKLVRQLIALTVIAVIASARRIRPHIFATPRLREDVVNRKLVSRKRLAFQQSTGLYTAVNARVIIPYQHTFTAPMRLPARYVDIRSQGDDRRNWKLITYSFEKITGLLNDDRFACQQQVDRTRYRNDRQWFPIAPVEQQYPVLQSENIRHNSTSAKTLLRWALPLR